MIASKNQIGIIAGLLIVFGLGLTLYKSVSLGLPLVPAQYQDVWTIESKITFSPGEGPVDVSMILPKGYNGWVTLNENFSSSGFGFTVQNDGDIRSARWTRSSLEEPATLYYKMQVYKAADASLPALPAVVASSEPDSPRYDKAMALYVDELRSKSSDVETFTQPFAARLLW